MSTTSTTSEGWFAFDKQDMMVFILVMSLTGLQNAVTEILPEFTLGPLELGVGEFVFIPIVLVLLFRTYWAALAVPVGEIVFGEILLGEFDGLGAMEGLLLIPVCYYFAAKLLQDPENTTQLALVVFIAEGLEEFFAMFIDIGKVYVGVEELEAVPGLPESIFVLEAVDLVTQMVITGIVFGVIPALYLYPKLHGKVEPLLGMEPYQGERGASMWGGFSLKAFLAILLAFPLAFVAEAASEVGGAINVVWEPEFLEMYGQSFIAVPIVVAAIVAVVVWYRATRQTS
ncbi:hypothetical protein [Haloarcula pellucida]|uniref:DUF8171 domain-containing protein n=1 Tax=Haloarcula pellucida TaxID=1427151 RepID=A0A830GQ90_9EURY|nr:hypothetical protein [Halomicroarcula pellucida]MBX0349628.1 hypothetical protein [Halomicroarcula pellucida]GGO02000.1 hypothetical protein GCM10009030_36150 [Halomicroarcula pellucida]